MFGLNRSPKTTVNFTEEDIITLCDRINKDAVFFYFYERMKK